MANHGDNLKKKKQFTTKKKGGLTNSEKIDKKAEQRLSQEFWKSKKMNR
jgi:hypothetical protein